MRRSCDKAYYALDPSSLNLLFLCVLCPHPCIDHVSFIMGLFFLPFPSFRLLQFVNLFFTRPPAVSCTRGHGGSRGVSRLENGSGRGSCGLPSVPDRKQERRVGDPIAPDYTLHLSRRHGSGNRQQGNSEGRVRWVTTHSSQSCAVGKYLLSR